MNVGECRWRVRTCIIELEQEGGVGVVEGVGGDLADVVDDLQPAVEAGNGLVVVGRGVASLGSSAHVLAFHLVGHDLGALSRGDVLQMVCCS